MKFLRIFTLLFCVLFTAVLAVPLPAPNPAAPAKGGISNLLSKVKSVFNKKPTPANPPPATAPKPSTAPPPPAATPQKKPDDKKDEVPACGLRPRGNTAGGKNNNCGNSDPEPTWKEPELKALFASNPAMGGPEENKKYVFELHKKAIDYTSVGAYDKATLPALGKNANTNSQAYKDWKGKRDILLAQLALGYNHATVVAFSLKKNPGKKDPKTKKMGPDEWQMVAAESAKYDFEAGPEGFKGLDGKFKPEFVLLNPSMIFKPGYDAIYKAGLKLNKLGHKDIKKLQDDVAKGRKYTVATTGKGEFEKADLSKSYVCANIAQDLIKAMIAKGK